MQRRFGEAPLVLISLDGFRADYLDRGRNPSLERLGQCGVRAPFMRPVFPTKTFPNHFTIVTVGAISALLNCVASIGPALGAFVSMVCSLDGDVMLKTLWCSRDVISFLKDFTWRHHMNIEMTSWCSGNTISVTVVT